MARRNAASQQQATQSDTKNQEEVVRDVRDYLNKTSRPEDCWALDISWAISQYLQLLDNVEESSEGAEISEGSLDTLQLFNRSSQQQTRRIGINFCLAGSLLFDATRAFAKKVDYLGASLNTTLCNLTSGNIQGTKLKKARGGRKLQKNVKGLLGAPVWAIPEVPESLDLMHLPWQHLSAKNPLDMLLPEEVNFHQSVVQTLSGAIGESVDDFAGALMKSPSLTYPRVSLCAKPRRIADQRKICLSRPAVCLMPRAQKQQVKDNKVFDALSISNLLESFKLTGQPMEPNGALSLPFLKKRGTTTRFSGPIHQSDSLHDPVDTQVPTPGCPSGVLPVIPEPRTSILRTPAAGQCGPDDDVHTSPEQKAAKVPSRPPSAPTSTVVRLDEHEVLGKDCPLKVGKTYHKPNNIALYNLKLADIDCPEVIELLVMGPKEYMTLAVEKRVALAAKISNWKIKKGLKTAGRGQKHTPSMDSVDFSVLQSAADIYEATKVDIRYHPLFEEIKIGTSPLEKYCLNDPAFSAISDILVTKLQPKKKSVTFVLDHTSDDGDGGVDTMNDDPPRSPITSAKGTPNFYDSPETGAPSAWQQHGSDGTSIADRLSTLHQSQVKEATAELTEKKTSLYELHRRVWRWRHRVEKWITFTMSLEPFLVPTYSTRIANHLQIKQATTEPNRINFREMVRNHRKHDVCRLFLTTLILANQHSFQIKNVVDGDGVGNLVVEVGNTTAASLRQDYFDTTQEQQEPENTKPKKRRGSGS
eukprot:Blabericola_migrator_1__13537@NODE_98_length_14373_cov_122_493220_g88_i0_p1_GENE_NODE_98_length_14373_cov_122_493220_g88_i0NODE_98_length_14373_cov_122_493220_g88_i0_p1_ORF_typecomplete_len757_score147_95CNDH2_C/PF16858_5/4_2e03CNDH2_C/PF16858_5/1e04CNDH2_C/PF16858_5/2_7e20CNDH2_N/PF06278_11/1_8e04CNDH2_N/PF06278_11/5_6e08CNDH2_N/PF06278_11/3_3e03_NODE_98_length_14373_cov_122_493220_g88_i019284198